MTTKKTPDDESYEQGVHDGQQANSVDQVAHSLTKGLHLPGEDRRRQEIYNKGYDYGVANPPRADHSDERHEVNTGSSASSAAESGCGQIIGVLLAILIIAGIVLWLLFNVVLPLLLLNSALILAGLAIAFKQWRRLFAACSVIGASYLLLDISSNWLSASFVNNIVHSSSWLAAFIYLNSAAAVLSVALLVQPLWMKGATVSASNAHGGMLLSLIAIVLVLLPGIVMPVLYHRVITKRSDTLSPLVPAVAQQVFNTTPDQCGVSLAFLDGFTDIGSRRLSAVDVSHLSATEMGVLRNYIFAKHGRPFQNPHYVRCFSQLPWYRPDPAFRDDMLNPIENANVQLLAEREHVQSATQSPTSVGQASSFTLSTFPKPSAFRCGSAYARSQNEFDAGRYIFVDGLNARCQIAINSKPIILQNLTPATASDPEEFTNNDYTVYIKIDSTEFVGDAHQVIVGSLTVKYHGAVIVKQPFYGLRGC